MLEKFVCVRLDGRESEENRLLKLEYGPVVMGNVQNRIVSPDGENLARFPTDFDTAKLVDYLERWAALYPGAPDAPAPPVPYFATLHQALNVAACDARVLVVVLGDDVDELEDLVLTLAWDPEFSGRFHFVRCLADDVTLPEITGIPAQRSDGIYLVHPDPFGMKGRAAGRFGTGCSKAVLLDAARSALRDFNEGFEQQSMVEKFQLHTERGERDWIYLTGG
ncbi:MAG: hypothetical protein PVJ51_05735, partial [Acidobacteriota bacterium]